MSTWTRVASLDDFAASDAIEVARGRAPDRPLPGRRRGLRDRRALHPRRRRSVRRLRRRPRDRVPAAPGRFDVRTGAATGAPADTPLATYPARLAGDQVELGLD